MLLSHLLPIVLQVLERTVSEEELRKKKKKMESKANDYKKATFIAICAKRQVCLADTLLLGTNQGVVVDYSMQNTSEIVTNSTLISVVCVFVLCELLHQFS